MNIVVLVGWHEHAVSGRAVINRNDAVAASLALAVPNAAVRLVCAGALPDSVARDYLALGAPRIAVLETPSHDVVAPLAEASRDSALVLTGLRAAGLGSGVVPYAIAERLHRPLIVDVIAAEPDAGGWRVTRALPRGARRRWHVDMPAVLAVHPNAPVALRHSWRDAQAGEVQRLCIDARGDAAGSPWTVVPAARQLQRLQVARPRSGHDRMLDAIATERQRSAGTVLTEGGADAKARAINDYLRAHSLLPQST
jgi:electron transfer flavoprotein beta subunit